MAEIGLAFRELPVASESAHSVAIAALFPFARQLAQSDRTKNPSWFRTGAALSAMSLTKSQLREDWKALLDQLSKWRSTQDDPDGFSSTVERGDSRKSLGRQEVFHGLLTSPPYLTRLDYVHATLPEILLLREFDTAPDLQRLRRSMLGSPLSSERPPHSLIRLPPDIRQLLRDIQGHSSKASASYYHRFFATYFVDLQASMRNIARVLKTGASGCIVVQSSHYKEIEVDLARAAISLGEELGLRHQLTKSFDPKRSISAVNSRAHKDAQKPKVESAVFFQKD